MAKRIRYRATSIEQISCEKLASKLHGAQKLVVAIDVAKTKMVAGFGPEDGSVACLVRWNSPTDNRAFVDLVTRTAQTLGVPVDAVLEPAARSRGRVGQGSQQSRGSWRLKACPPMAAAKSDVSETHTSVARPGARHALPGAGRAAA